MAVAGRFITKWLIVWGMVTTRGSSLPEGEEDAALRENFTGILTLFSLNNVVSRTFLAACLMKVWPSSQKAWTKFQTCT